PIDLSLKLHSLSSSIQLTPFYTLSPYTTLFRSQSPSVEIRSGARAAGPDVGPRDRRHAHSARSRRLQSAVVECALALRPRHLSAAAFGLQPSRGQLVPVPAAGRRHRRRRITTVLAGQIGRASCRARVAI